VRKDSQKATNLARDNRVSLTIDRDTTDPMAIRSLSMAARAFPVTDGVDPGGPACGIAEEVS
jgi:hypothetical protein